ncbi:hypothetical protein GOP47_0000076 [Adiantum capillus-veneris]|uniref:Uncharacterized protein n=1 Tax=Adiantum capillus-veneris TaxID=13818 RepID=A0A9D4VEF1_ADICA|nr:hypothetical protein GOP47_0000076 [Adiantum capillus-veneris]
MNLSKESPSSSLLAQTPLCVCLFHATDLDLRAVQPWPNPSSFPSPPFPPSHFSFSLALVSALCSFRSSRRCSLSGWTTARR